MSFDAGKLAGDAVPWLCNVSTSVSIIFVNKLLMSNIGYGFHYVTTLSGLHYAVCTLSIWLAQPFSGKAAAKLPSSDLALFTLTADLSIVSLTLSLLMNNVTLYQNAKLLIVPFVCLVEKFWLGNNFSPKAIAAILMVLLGVAIVTVTDIDLGHNTAGLVVAAVSIVSSGLQQVLCRSMQQKHKISSHELLANTAPAQSWTLLLAGPLLDFYITRSWVTQYAWSLPACIILIASCTLAVAVNMSQFMCLGRFSAVSFQTLSANFRWNDQFGNHLHPFDEPVPEAPAS